MLDVIKTSYNKDVTGKGLLAVVDEPGVGQIMDLPAWDGVHVDMEGTRSQAKFCHSFAELIRIGGRELAVV